MVTLPSALERQRKFQRLFLKKIAEERTRLQGQRKFPGPLHKLAEAVTQRDIATIRSTQKSDVGLSLIYFQSRTGPLLLTTTGIFFRPKDDDKGHIAWPDLDAVAMRSLAYDDSNVNIEKDDDLLAKTSSKITPMIPTGIIVLLMFFILGQLTATMFFLIKLVVVPLLILAVIISVPYIYAIFLYNIRTNMKKTYFKKHPEQHNVIYMRPWHSRANIGAVFLAEDIVVCIKLALTIFRLQRAKYASSENLVT